MTGQFPPGLRLVRPGYSPRMPSGYVASLTHLQPLWATISAGLMPHQCVGADAAYRAMETTGGFLLADGTGAGKTSSILAVAELYRAAPVRPRRVLVIAPSEALGKPWMVNPRHPVLAGSYASDSERMGVPVRLCSTGRELTGHAVCITSYDRMQMGDFAAVVDESVVLIFDEAHYLKNVAGKAGAGSQRGEYGTRMAEAAWAVLAATATPGDQVHHMAHLYRCGILEGKSVKHALDHVGIRYKDPRPVKVGYALAGAIKLSAVYAKSGGGLGAALRVYPDIADLNASAKGMGAEAWVFEVATEKMPRGPKWEDGGVGWLRSDRPIPPHCVGRAAKWREGFDPDQFHDERNDAAGRWGDRLIKPASITAAVPAPELQKNVAQLFNRMTAAGTMLKREIDMTGLTVDFDFKKAPGDDIRVEGKTWRQVQKVILEAFWEEDVFPAGGLTLHSFGGLQKAIVTGHLRRALETFKLPRVIAAAENAVRQGRRFVIFAERVNRSDVHIRDDSDDYVKRLVHSSEGTLKLIREELRARGITYSELHGDSGDASAAAAMDAFQSGRVQGVLATAQSGGTGINLDDTTGDAPRDMIVMTAPYGATENVQMLGRVHRLTTRSASHATYVFFDTEVDRKAAAVMVTKLRFLGAMVRGGVADMAVNESLLRGMGLSDEEVSEALLLAEHDDRVTQAKSSVGNTADMQLVPLDEGDPTGPWKLTGRTYQHVHRIKAAIPQKGRAWDSVRKLWIIGPGYLEYARIGLGKWLEAADDPAKGMPGALPLAAFVDGIAKGTLAPGRSQALNASMRRLALLDRAAALVDTEIVRAHREAVRAALLVGWPVPPPVAALYPEIAAQAVATQEARKGQSAVVEAPQITRRPVVREPVVQVRVDRHGQVALL